MDLDWIRRQPFFDAIVAPFLASGRDVVLLGGALRDHIRDPERMPRDWDFAVMGNLTEVDSIRLAPLAPTTNALRGMKIMYEGVEIDLWAFPDTWAIRRKLVEGPVSAATLVRTVPFTADAVALSLATGDITEAGFSRTFETGELDLVLTPVIEREVNQYNLLRARRLRLRFGLTLSPRLREVLTVWLKYADDDRMKRISFDKYGAVVTLADLRRDLLAP